MSENEEDEVPNDPRQRHSRGPAVRSRGPMPYVLVSLALWLVLLVAFPAWMIGDLVVMLLASCVAGALAPLLPGSGAGRSGVRIGGLARGS